MFQYDQPDSSGHFGPYGGSFASETLTFALRELQAAYARYQHDPEFIAEFKRELADFVGRPSPIYHAARMSHEIGGAQIYFKREDLNPTTLAPTRSTTRSVRPCWPSAWASPV